MRTLSRVVENRSEESRTDIVVIMFSECLIVSDGLSMDCPWVVQASAAAVQSGPTRFLPRLSIFRLFDLNPPLRQKALAAVVATIERGACSDCDHRRLPSPVRSVRPLAPLPSSPSPPRAANGTRSVCNKFDTRPRRTQKRHLKSLRPGTRPSSRASRTSSSSSAASTTVSHTTSSPRRPSSRPLCTLLAVSTTMGLL